MKTTLHFLGQRWPQEVWVSSTLPWYSYHVCVCGLGPSVVSDSLWPRGLWPSWLLCPWDSPGGNSGVGCHALLQGVFPAQELNQGLPHYRQILHCLSHPGSSRILEWVAYPFSRGSSQPRNQSRVSCIAGGFFTSWATREALAILLCVCIVHRYCAHMCVHVCVCTHLCVSSCNNCMTFDYIILLF